jgi:hypothetical protein
MGFLAMNKTEFAQNMVEYLLSEIPPPVSGYIDGIDENGRLASRVTDKTNGLIISAARYAEENSHIGVSPLQKSDLRVLPWPFIQDGVVNNTALVIGESRSHGPVGAAQTVETIGGIFITEGLARESSVGKLKAEIDSWITTYDPISRNVTIWDTTSNFIVVGNPGNNILGYYYNNLRGTTGEPLVPVVFLSDYAESNNYLYIPTSGSRYRTEFDGQGRLLADYGVIMSFQDQLGRYVVMVYGLDAIGTLGASQVLGDYSHWQLRGSAVIVKSYANMRGNYPNNASIVEIVP